MMQRKHAETFREQRDPIDGTPWKKSGELTISTRPGKGGGAKTLQDTTRLMRDITQSRPQIAGNRVSIGTTAKYGPIHQSGGKIKPRIKKWLAIPLTKQARRSGTASRWWKSNESKKPFVIISKKSVGAGFIVTSKNGKMTRHWLLKKEVNIPRRRYLGLSTRDKEDIGEALINMIRRELRASA